MLIIDILCCLVCFSVPCICLYLVVLVFLNNVKISVSEAQSVPVCRVCVWSLVSVCLVCVSCLCLCLESGVCVWRVWCEQRGGGGVNREISGQSPNP